MPEYAVSALLDTLTENEFPQQQSDRLAGEIGEAIVRYVSDSIQASTPTPIAQVKVVVSGRPRTILLKLEGCSRWGSMKRRTALALIASVATRVTDKTTIIESTSGNLGVALAGICRDLRIPFTAVVDSRLPAAMSGKMEDSGARLDTVEDADDSLHLRRRIERVREILRDDPHALWPNQYENPANVAVHRWWTGPELGRQVGPEVQAVFAPVSTGGSFTGVYRHFSEERPEVACVAVDVVGSTIFGGTAGCRLLTGIGASKPSPFVAELINPPHVMVSDVAAIAVCRALADDVGISVGGSSGATVAACLRFLSERADLGAAVCICPDMGDNYQQSIYAKEWLAENGALAALSRPYIAGQLIDFARMHD
jgi:cysteine synthase